MDIEAYRGRGQARRRKILEKIGGTGNGTVDEDE